MAPARPGSGPSTGRDDRWELARAQIGDPGAVELHIDPHAIAIADDGAWVASAAAHALVLIDPATNAVGRPVGLDVEPYALAIKGRTAWVTSFVDDALVKVDLDLGLTLATTKVMKPTGVAIGAGAVWVVEHRDNSLVRVDPASAGVVARVDLGAERPNDVCGACVENVVVAAGAVWTSDNYLRSVSRIDPRRNRVVARIELPLRVWAVAAGGGRIWASQFDPDGGSMDDWMTASIDPDTNQPTTYGLPSQSVSWAGDALWVVQPGHRSDTVVRVDTQPAAPVAPGRAAPAALRTGRTTGSAGTTAPRAPGGYRRRRGSSPSLEKIVLIRASTVFADRNSRSAIAALERPSAISARTSRSRSVSAASGTRVAARGRPARATSRVDHRSAATDPPHARR